MRIFLHICLPFLLPSFHVRPLGIDFIPMHHTSMLPSIDSHDRDVSTTPRFRLHSLTLLHFNRRTLPFLIIRSLFEKPLNRLQITLWSVKSYF
ncbi:hypothetical protein BDQ12DRAFT_354264 [Crucibulum laeve]|uniref:Secreted protein n=1 Tax=Crucibulum laeve TaxID=68775 RepID=A0A5C3M9L4_9AGAR|nr:hypothetical protein BDQ12DRAFT_354264 [Crucibulum laeve]